MADNLPFIEKVKIQAEVLIPLVRKLGAFQDRLYPSVPLAVIPAKAGIHLPGGALDSRMRGNDGPGSVL